MRNFGELRTDSRRPRLLTHEVYSRDPRCGRRRAGTIAAAFADCLNRDNVNRNRPNRLTLSGYGQRQLHRTARPVGRALGRSSARLVWVLGFMKAAFDLVHFHEREAARLRRLLANATTPAVKARLLEEAEQHERLAKPPKHRMDDQAARSKVEMAEP